MKDLISRIKAAFKIATTKEIIVYWCEPHRCLPDGTIESTSSLLITKDIHPLFVEFAFDDCLNQFDDNLNVIVEQTEMEFLATEAKMLLK